MLPEAIPFDSLEYRKTLGVFPTGVTVVTARADDGGFRGLTVSSFNTLSLEPPLVLWSLLQASPSRRIFDSAAYFAINVLAAEQHDLSRQFATSADNKFAGVDFTLGRGEAPLIAGCAAYFECRTYSRQRAGDHWLIIGQVERFARTGRAPLVFCQGQYHAAVPLSATEKPDT